jgi:hypothetical protein
MEEKTVHWPLFTTQWKRLVRWPRHRWKILVSSYKRCDVPDAIDLALGACKPRMNVYALWMWEASVLVRQLLLYKKAMLWAWWPRNHPSISGRGMFSLIFVGSRQPLRPAQPPVQSILRVKWLGQEANHLSLSSASVKNVWSCMWHCKWWRMTMWSLPVHSVVLTLNVYL